ncbi:hypothetical protein [Guyparkeria sp.]|uniref:hypothetical protein n=1 Tax=Guyparkeria sp. TaxID=2035736 RepID=UPI003970D80E
MQHPDINALDSIVEYAFDAVIITEARRDAGAYLMGYYDSVRPHQYLEGKTPAETEKSLNELSKIA